jgi:hypothetical protein
MDAGQNVSQAKKMWSNFREADAPNVGFVSGESNIATISNTYGDIANLELRFVSTGGPVRVTFNMPWDSGAGAFLAYAGLNIDGVMEIERGLVSCTASGQPVLVHIDYITYDTAGVHTYKAQWHTSGGNSLEHDGQIYGPRVLSAEEL